MPSLSFYGHAYNRVFTYTEDGIHHELKMRDGVHLLYALSNPNVADRFDVIDGFDRMYYEVRHFKDKQRKKSYWSIDRYLGKATGTVLEKIIQIDSGENLVVWDAGFTSLGGLSLPEMNGSVLWAAGKILPDREQFAKISDRCFLFLDADVLRLAGAMISRGISWERTVMELIWQLQNNSAISYLLKAPHVLIAFAEDGAVYIKRENGELKASLSLTHGSGEGTLRSRLHGELIDSFLFMTANLAQQFTEVMNGKEPFRTLPLLKTAEYLVNTGYDLQGSSKEHIVLKPSIIGRNFEEIMDEQEVSFDIPIKPGQNAIDPDNWCISNNVGGKRIFDTAFEYVMEGEKAIDKLPQLSFGAFITVDRWEIEAFQNIRNLIVGYAESDGVRPLSIAVFGSPGSGKSFGVTQIAKNVLPGKIEKLEFNVSQFTGPADLGAAFQKVRDVILEGKLPLVFFDEFDSDRDGLPLGWIKNFLMPMQDGKFRDESGEHPLGKCILVFAGGTAASFEKFSSPLKCDSPEEQQRFKSVKGPDFISRLKGTINVLGPNPKSENDNNYILRRALLLRSLCERKMDIKHGKAPVSSNIIWAMLLVPKYNHGARSMEAILDMSRFEGNVWEPVSLPFYSQLSLHVDADAFIKLVLREVILNSYIEQLAQAVHSDFLKEMTAAGKTEQSSVVPWDELSEEYKESNRHVARGIGRNLNFVGCAYDAGDTPFPSVEEFDEPTLLLLAKKAHSDYMDQKFAAGWTWGEKRDDRKKTNPTLVDWDNLPDDERKKDFDIAKNIIPLLKSIGLRVYKTV